jgi:transcriptional regulator GlxA family with amidase domain
MLAFDGVRLMDVAGPLEVFDVAVALGCRYAVGVYAASETTTVRCSSGVTLAVHPRSALPDVPDTLLVPGGECLVRRSAPDDLTSVIRQYAAAARRTASICAGSFALATAGLLDGKRATTHWRHLDLFASRFPSIVVDRTSVYARDGSVWSSAGVVAGVDLALALVAEDYGTAMAHEIGKDMVVFSRRMDGHPQLSVAARTPRPKHPELDRLLQTINAEPARKYTLDSVGRQIGVSPRHLARLFSAQVGTSLREYVLSVRLETAVGLVLSGESFHSAARRAGLRDGSQVRDFLAGEGLAHGTLSEAAAEVRIASRSSSS